MVLECDDADPVVFDLGTGLRFWGLDWPTSMPFAATALVSHLHWDHVQGLPFFGPLHKADSKLDVFGPAQDGRSLAEAVDGFMCPPYFPVRVTDLLGSFSFSEATSSFVSDGYQVSSAPVPHPGPTLGYRVERGGISVAYVPDHQQPGCGSTVVDPGVLALCAGADLLIHDAQYTPSEFMQKFDWGHCTIDYAIEVARQAGVSRLALFHHDPSHTDDDLDALAVMAAKAGAAAGLAEVIVASEGMVISLGGSSSALAAGSAGSVASTNA